MIDRKPSVIVRPTGIADVIQSVRFAREHGLAASVRGGGHSVAGKSVADGVIMIDLSLMREVQINPGRQTALAQGGATWGEFDREGEKFGLATTGGVISSTGVCGLTLGGGIGWLMGKHGLSCDNVVSADLVNADGNHLSVSATQNEDLFWAIRGGGGNFGIVTALEFRLHELASIHGGIVLYPRPAAFDLLATVSRPDRNAPDELTAYAALLTGHGHPMAAVALCHSGSNADRADVCKQFYLDVTARRRHDRRKEIHRTSNHARFHGSGGRALLLQMPVPPRAHRRRHSASILDHTEQMPTEQTQVVLEHMHGAASRVPVEQTAFGLRRVHYSINIMPAWTDPSMAEKCITWAQELCVSTDRLRGVGCVRELSRRRRTVGGQGLLRRKLRAARRLKKKYDPDNFFRFNQNIVPAGLAARHVRSSRSTPGTL